MGSARTTHDNKRNNSLDLLFKQESIVALPSEKRDLKSSWLSLFANPEASAVHTLHGLYPHGHTAASNSKTASFGSEATGREMGRSVSGDQTLSITKQMLRVPGSSM